MNPMNVGKSGVFEGELVRARFKKTIEMIPPEVNSLVDLGCGNGRFIEILKNVRKMDRLIGVDRSTQALEHIKGDIILSDISNVSGLADSSFDCVSCQQVIEHIPVGAYQEVLKEICRLSSKYLLVSIPNSEDLTSNYTRCPECLSIFNRDLHLRSFPPDYFRSLFEEHGFRLKNLAYEGEEVHFKGLDMLKRLLRGGRSDLGWDSPICVVCGHKSAYVNKAQEATQRAGKLKPFKSVLRKFWPHTIKYYWAIGLFEKVG